MTNHSDQNLFFLSGDDSDSICAISTPQGVGGISVIRVSGPQSFQISRKICAFLPTEVESHRIYYGFAKHPETNEKLDEVLVSCFADGKSFTGEESTEISCHGNPLIAESIVQALILAGARLARPGEFTCRAFFNNKIDLVQAESVLSLIESQSKQASRMALRQLEGELSTEYLKIEDAFVWILAQIEAGIDFSTEGLNVVSYDKISERLQQTQQRVQSLMASYEAGRIVKDGLVVSLLGQPNVGKSSLLNALAKEELAIVTDEPGTTRDLVTAKLRLGGVTIHLVDTAGLREASNKVEQIGIRKSLAMMEKSDVLLYVVEAGDEIPKEFLSSAMIAGQEKAICFNKVDLRPSSTQKPDVKCFEVSAQTGLGLEQLKNWLSELATSKSSESQILVSQARHFELLSKIQLSLNSAAKLIKEDLSSEFVAQEMQIGIRAIHELLGKSFDEQVIDRIFKEFCLGK